MTTNDSWWKDRIPRENETVDQAIRRLHQNPEYGGSLEDAKAAVYSAIEYSAIDFSRGRASEQPSATRPTDTELFETDFRNTEKVHDWRNHIGEHTQALWITFTPAQRRALMLDAENRASQEDWD